MPPCQALRGLAPTVIVYGPRARRAVNAYPPPRPNAGTCLPGDGGFPGRVDVEVVPEARYGEDALHCLGGCGESQGGILFLQGFLGAHERREGGRIHELNVAHIHNDHPYAFRTLLYGVLDLGGRVQVHLAAYRDYRVGIGVLVYADLEVHLALVLRSLPVILEISCRRRSLPEPS